MTEDEAGLLARLEAEVDRYCRTAVRPACGNVAGECLGMIRGLIAERDRLKAALAKHHAWHLGQDRDGAAWGIDPVDAYIESGLGEETTAALAP